MCTLWQRFGRAARDLARHAKALFFVEPKHFDEVRAQRTTRQQEKKRKAAEHAEEDLQKRRPAKRVRVQVHSSSALEPAQGNSSMLTREHEDIASVLERSQVGCADKDGVLGELRGGERDADVQ
jgi:superfamily II DNA helicase RecQ